MSSALPMVIQIVLCTHVLAGLLALVIAPVPLLTAKGGRTHRRWGRIYFWAMAVVAASAMVLALWRPILFLAFIAIFSFYLAFRGYRVLSRKNPSQGQRARAIDWVAAILAFFGSVSLVVLGIVRPGAVWTQLGTVAIVFGIIGGTLSVNDLWKFVHPPTNNKFWWYAHMAGMLGSYIAAVSAFSVVNFHFLPTLVRWLWPTVIGVPGIALWVRHYRRKFEILSPIESQKRMRSDQALGHVASGAGRRPVDQSR
jgi:uncharacterized membrane protein